MKTAKSFVINYYKTNRKNSRVQKKYSIAVDNYDITLLYEIINNYIQWNKINECKYVSIVFGKSFHADKGLCYVTANSGMGQKDNYASIEQFINKIVSIMLMLSDVNENNREMLEKLLHAHDDVIIRRLITKYYHR